MKTLQDLIESIPTYAKDVKTNIQNFVSEKNPVLTPKHVFGSALTVSYVLKDKSLIEIMEFEAKKYLSADEISLARTASIMMAMTNSYYCFTHISSDKEFLDMPVGLVMKSAKNQNIDFEVFALAASIINSCSICIDSHQEKLINAGFRRKEIQMVAQISAIFAAVAQLLVIKN
jgi:alkyl hydroperoxide reductase subunit D